MAPRETANNAYAKFGVINKEHYAMVFSGVVNFEPTRLGYLNPQLLKLVPPALYMLPYISQFSSGAENLLVLTRPLRQKTSERVTFGQNKMWW